jgi:hypothetical protein
VSFIGLVVLSDDANIRACFTNESPETRLASRDVVYEGPEGSHKERDHRHPLRKHHQPGGDDGGHTQHGCPDLARRVFWVVDNGSSHHGWAAAARLRAAWPRAVLIHTPIHASWLNQVEIYLSIVKRKALTPRDFVDLVDAEDRLHRFEQYYQASAAPFEWKFTRADLTALLRRLAAHQSLQPAA